MLITCPECSGKLSSVAPTCPHCGFVQAVAKPAAPASPPSAAPPPAPAAPAPELILPSDKSVRKASRLLWSEWIHSTTWRLFFGAVILLAALGLMILIFLLANRMNDSQPAPLRMEKASTP
ncbi:MAG: hypothetical protein HY293_11590 [Planctomycetes bacterium]|nr:hypothetical protein [Planctomycetota bacterium]